MPQLLVFLLEVYSRMVLKPPSTLQIKITLIRSLYISVLVPAFTKEKQSSNKQLATAAEAFSVFSCAAEANQGLLASPSPPEHLGNCSVFTSLFSLRPVLKWH